jgi:hypothetical protein
MNCYAIPLFNLKFYNNRKMSSRAVIYLVLLFVVSCVGVFRYKHLSLPFKILAWSVIMIFFTFLADRYCVKNYHTNAPTLQFQAFEEYIFYATVYYFLFKDAAIKKIIILSIIVLIVFFPINAIFLQPFFSTFPTNITTPVQLLYAIFSLLLFKEMLSYSFKIDLIKQGIFWFNIAIFFYSTTAFLLLALTNYFSKMSFKENEFIFYIWWGIGYLFHVLICIALLTRSRENIVAEKTNGI